MITLFAEILARPVSVCDGRLKTAAIATYSAAVMIVLTSAVTSSCTSTVIV
jgi:hypothetical protein